MSKEEKRLTPSEKIQKYQNTKIESIDLTAKNEDEIIKDEKLFAKLSTILSLNQMNLSGQRIKEFPDSFTRLTKIKKLVLSKSRLENLPKNIGIFPNLQILKIRLNKLKRWPFGPGHRFHQIRELDMGFNQLTMIKRIDKKTMSTLRVLDISFNHFEEFPTKILEIRNLEELDLSDNTLKRIPLMINRLENLRILNLEKIGLTSFPMGICDLFHLCILNLSRNRIKSLPCAIDGLNQLVSLREVYLSHCELLQWGNLKCQAKLRILDLSYNEIMAIPIEIKTLCCLKELRLNNNCITDIPDHISDLSVLEYLDFSHNRIKEIDKNIGKMEYIKVLRLNNNEIKELPEEFKNLKNLQELNLSMNKLRKIPEVTQMKSLKTLDASLNRIYDIPKGFSSQMKNLIKINFADNHITNIPEQFYSLQALQSLGLRGNAIEQLKPPQNGIQWKNLEEWNLEGNELKKIPDEICTLKHLKKLGLSYNHENLTFNEKVQKWIKEENVVVTNQFEKLSKVEDTLWISSANAAASKYQLKQNNITHVLTVADDIPPPHVGSFEYMIVYVKDYRASSLLPNFAECFRFIDEGVKSGGCLIHCRAGVSRSTTILIAYLMNAKKWTVKESFQYVRKKRPQAHPNATFRSELKRFEEKLYQQRSLSMKPKNPSKRISFAKKK